MSLVRARRPLAEQIRRSSPGQAAAVIDNLALTLAYSAKQPTEDMAACGEVDQVDVGVRRSPRSPRGIRRDASSTADTAYRLNCYEERCRGDRFAQRESTPPALSLYGFPPRSPSRAGGFRSQGVDAGEVAVGPSVVDAIAHNE
jgi:hypothetical protein